MRILLLTAGLLMGLYAYPQAKIRPFSNIINHPSINISAPYVSADNSSIAYLSDDAPESMLTLFYSRKEDAVNWGEPAPIPKTAINQRLSFPWGFALDASGQALYLTSIKSGGLGGFDIYLSELEDGSWSAAVNVGLPVNSLEHEGAPSISADGATIYFMRCSSMSREGAAGCRLMVSQRNAAGAWSEALALPDYINTGNSQAPRIMADGETLIFSSDQLPGGKGKMDLYMTRLEENKWSAPVAMDFANTVDHDQYVSAAATGRYLVKDVAGNHSREIVELLFPPDLKPKACARLEGKAIGLNEENGRAYINLFCQGKRVYASMTDGSGVFGSYLTSGKAYVLTVEPEKGDHIFYTKQYDLSKGPIPSVLRVEAKMKPIAAGASIALEGIDFEPHSAQLAASSDPVLKAMARAIKSSPGQDFVLEASFSGYRSDSLRSDPDLTEERLDTLAIDSSQGATAPAEEGALAAADSVDSAPLPAVKIHAVYHNDRTPKQAAAIIKELAKRGAPTDKVQTQYRVSSDGGRDGATFVLRAVR